MTAGLHKSPFKGLSVEFAEHRQHGPGHEIRHVDWRTFGKTDRIPAKGGRGPMPLWCVLHALADRIRRRGPVIIHSDGFDSIDNLTTALRHLRHQRHEVLFMQN